MKMKPRDFCLPKHHIKILSLRTAWIKTLSEVILITFIIVFIHFLKHESFSGKNLQ